MAEPRPPRRVTPVELSRCVQADEWRPSPHPHACAGQWPQIHVMDGFVSYRISSPRHVEWDARVRSITQRRAGYRCSRCASSFFSPMRRIAADRMTCTDAASRVSLF
jgi:DNA-directed RNA polymerase subunit RPC12/RpoP